jgi:hypothetical protein
MLKGSDARNAIADTAQMHLSCRYISTNDYHLVVKLLNEVTGLEVRATPGRLPVENRKTPGSFGAPAQQRADLCLPLQHHRQHDLYYNLSKVFPKI